MAVDDLLLAAFVREHPAESARVLEAFAAPDAAAPLSAIAPAYVGAVLDRMAPSQAADVLEAMSDEVGAAVISALDLDSAAALLRRVEDVRREALLAAAPRETAEPLRLLLSSPVGSAGSLMDARVFALPVDVDVAGGLERLRLAASDVMYYLYVVERDGVLVGVMTVRELLLASPHQRIEEIMRPGPERLRASADTSAILAHSGWAEYHALPVVDDDGRFVGAIRHETLRRLAREDDVGAERGAVSVIASLGELYWMGLTGVLDGIAHMAAGGDDA